MRMKTKSCHCLLLIFLLALFSLPVHAQAPSGYYDDAIGLSGAELKQALHQIIDDHQEYSYNDLRDFILKATDEDPENPDNVILLYTGRSQAKNTFGGNPDEWNREHVWAKSHGDFGNTPPAGTDAHHIRPTDVSVNGARGNLDFDEGGNPVPEAPGCFMDGDSFEPRDAVKGDVARMLFYMAVRYEGDAGEPDLEVVDYVNTAPASEHGRLQKLLDWHLVDPPDAFEQNRNEVIYGYQQNRNPFIDHPEFVQSIWGDPNGIAYSMPGLTNCFPNPVTDVLTIVIKDEPYGHYSLYSLDGRLIKRGKLEQSVSQLPVLELENGFYTLLLQATDGRPLQAHKLVKINR